ncbi:MAG: response regulator [Bacteroidetes bacterium]|nr:MAG: response regulator [Bacteroidota bacterium]REK03551.1 MAG: response regulator [Bacteroidota bacterium]REK34513.1 MAG: response regulator [Bacteroidota bacterium]REK50369.1 MAG: response regulator [Bacteroidota bacterium]
MNILVVDDERDVEQLFRQRFRNEIKNGQINLTFAFDGLEAIDWLNNNPDSEFQVILSDINMPKLSGLELLRQVKKNFPKIRFIMVSAYGDSNNYSNAMSYGANEFVTKPVDFTKLKELIFQ